MKTDVIVIGTGFGGAVSAANLARAGMNVCILERGTWWGESQKRRAFPRSLTGLVRSVHSVHLSNRKFNLSLPLNPRGLFEIHEFNGPNVIAGVGVGGSSLVYAGISQRPPSDFFDSFPAELSWSAMENYYQKVEQVLRPSALPLETEKSQKFKNAVSAIERAKYHPVRQAIFWGNGPDTDEVIENRWGIKQANCRFCDHCTPGCNRGAKNSLDLNLIPEALNAGAELRDLCRVDYITTKAGEYEVIYRSLRNLRRVRLTAPRVVLAAGTINTHKILLRSRKIPGGLTELSPMLGKRFSMGGDTSKSYANRDFDFDCKKGHIAEGIMEVIDMDGRTDHYVFPIEFILGDRLRRRPSHHSHGKTLRMIGFGRDNADGELSWNGKALSLTMPNQDVLGRIKKTMHAISLAYSNSGQEPITGNADEKPRSLRVRTSAHPMGGCRMGDSADAGVVDHRGEVFNYPGLFIADASVFCGPPVCAPSLSIAAMSWRISDMVLHSRPD